jgi:hypothetical protein
MKQTAVEFLVDNLEQNKFITKSQIHIAKEMEKQQIIDAHGNQTKKSGGVSNYTYILTGEEYYNETFKNN